MSIVRRPRITPRASPPSRRSARQVRAVARRPRRPADGVASLAKGSTRSRGPMPHTGAERGLRSGSPPCGAGPGPGSPGFICTHRSAAVPASGPRTLPGAPIASMPSGISVPGVTRAPAATMARTPMRAPSSSGGGVTDQGFLAEPAAWTRQRCPTVAPAPMSTPPRAVTWITAQSCTLAPRRITIGLEVGAEHGVVPDGGVLLDRDVADQVGGGGDEGASDARAGTCLRSEEWHAVAPWTTRECSKRCPRLLDKARAAGCSLGHGRTEDRCRRHRHSSRRFDAGHRPCAWRATTIARRMGFFDDSLIETRHLYFDPETLHARRERGPAQRRGSAAARSRSATAAVARGDRAGGLAAGGRGLPRHHHVHRARCAEPRRAHRDELGLRRDRPARARGRHRLRRARWSRCSRRPTTCARSPAHRAVDGGGRDLLGGLLPRRPARERSGPRDLRGRGGGHRGRRATGRGRRSSSTARCSDPSISTRWASSIRAGGRGWSCPRTCGASARA